MTKSKKIIMVILSAIWLTILVTLDFDLSYTERKGLAMVGIMLLFTGSFLNIYKETEDE